MKRWTAVGFAALAWLFAEPAVTAQSATEETSVAVVVHVSTPPLFTADGTPAPDRDERLQVLANALDALGASDIAKFPLALAPSAVMCDEVSRLRGAAPKHFLRSLRKVAARSTVLSAPFANVRVPDLAAGSVRREIAAGRSAIERCTSVAPSSDLYPPGLILDDASLRAAKAAGAVTSLTTSIDDPVRAGLDLLPAVIAPAHDTPAALLARRPSTAFAVVAEVGSATAPYVRALATSSSIRLLSLDAAAATATPRTGLSLPTPAAPPVAYRRALVHADESFARFAAFTLRDNPLTSTYRDVLARARSSADMSGDFAPGRRLADGLVRRVASAARRVSVGSGSITFTSRRGSVPVTVINHDPYPVRVAVAVESPKLDFPDGEVRVVTVQPPGDTFTFNAVARSTGSFPMLASIQTVDGSFVLNRGELTVRSTAANLPALAVTIGGFVLLVVFYVRRKKRKT